MRKAFVPIILLIFSGILATYSHDYFLLPDEFYLTKGQTLKLHLFVGDEFKELEERKYESSKTAGFRLFDGGKKIDLKESATDSLMPVLSRKLNNSGLALIAMERNQAEITLEKQKFIEYLNEEGLDGIAKQVEKSPKTEFKEKYTRYIKALVTVDKPSGNLYNEKLKQELEILLLQNPYKMKYGDDMVAEVLFRGKPLVNAKVEVVTKVLNDKVFTTEYRTDKDGDIYFKLNRSGVWLVRLVHMLPNKAGDTDFESFWAGYTFGFKQ